jgi:hypothetical protein
MEVASTGSKWDDCKRESRFITLKRNDGKCLGLETSNFRQQKKPKFTYFYWIDYTNVGRPGPGWRFGPSKHFRR